VSAARNTAAFTLIELMTVIALIGTLLAMLFPVFAKVREKARQSVCSSNLRQIGIAVALYAQDYDDLYPYGADPVDKFTGAWGVTPTKDPVLSTMPLLHDVLAPYIRSRDVWRCPSDIGFDVIEFHEDRNGEAIPHPARPSLYQAFGTSYYYRTELTFRRVLYPAVGYSSTDLPGQTVTEHSPAEINVLQDAHGLWHGDGRGLTNKRYNLLYADGHVKLNNWFDMERAWNWSLVR
jgi:general secretion pathway protein G